MISLKESILSGTKTGKSSFIHKIDKWWNSIKSSKEKGNYYIINENKLNYIIIDDFAHQPVQHQISLSKNEIDTMPKELNGIYFIYKNKKDDEGIKKPVSISCNNIVGGSINFSNLKYTNYNQEDLMYDMIIKFFNCRNIEVNGLPEIDNRSVCLFDYGKNININNIRNKNLTIRIDNIDEFNITDCNVNEIDFMPYCKPVFNKEESDEKVLYFSNEANDIIDNIISKNKVNKVCCIMKITNQLHRKLLRQIKEKEKGKYFIEIK